MSFNVVGNEIFQRFVTNKPGEVETIHQPFWSFQEYPAAGQLNFTFFQQPIGQGGLTLEDTNMKAAGAFDAGSDYLMTAVYLDLFPSEADIDDGAASVFARDVYRVMSHPASMTLTIASKPYLEIAPLMRLVPRSRLDVEISQTINATDASYAAGQGKAMELFMPLHIRSQQNFRFTITFQSLRTIATAARIGLTIDGYLRRPVQ